MISNQNTSTDPQLSREEAIEILNTPDENLDEPGLKNCVENTKEIM